MSNRLPPPLEPREATGVAEPTDGGGGGGDDDDDDDQKEKEKGSVRDPRRCNG